MKIYFDTEFHEDGRVLELISLGAVRDDGKEYYAQVIETSHKQCNDWVKVNVIPKLQLCPRSIHRDDHKWVTKGKCGDEKCYWRTLPQIAFDLKEFTKETDSIQWWADYGAYDWVMLCKLYGTMMNIPKEWKYFCDLHDLEQIILKNIMNEKDEKKFLRKKPIQNEKEKHHALNDARHNKKMYEFLMIQLNDLMIQQKLFKVVSDK